MKTSVMLPKSLIKETKGFAAKNGKTFKAVVEMALQDFLEGQKDIIQSSEKPDLSRMKGLQVKNPLL